MIVSMVSDLTTEIFECGDGIEARRTYEVHRPDLVLMDLAMPGMDGIAATRLITSSFPEAKIIIVTSYEGAAIRESALEAGAFVFLPKENIADLRGIILNSASLAP